MSPALAACEDASQGGLYRNTFKALLAKIREVLGRARIRRPMRSFFNMQLQGSAETTTTILQRGWSLLRLTDFNRAEVRFRRVRCR